MEDTQKEVLKQKIEAVLFTTAKFMSLQEITDLCNITSSSITKKLLEELQQDYSQKSSSLTIQEEFEKFKLNVKKEFGAITNKLASGSELDSPTTKTLAVIAFKNPLLQSEIIKIRGNKAYDHIKQLLESAMITSEKKGRTRLIKLTPKFFDYFDIAEKELKQQFSQLSQTDMQKILDNLPKPDNLEKPYNLNTQEPKEE